MAKSSTASVPSDPAVISYFYGPGMVDLGKIVKQVFKNIIDSIKSTHMKSGDSVYSWLFFFIVWLGTEIGTILVGLSFCLFMIVPQIVFTVLLGVLVILGTNIMKVVDSLVLHVGHVSQVCDHCHERFPLPIYLCPTCGAKHLTLTPNKYGVFHHTCTCGTRLASCALVAKNPRRKLDAICPNCWKSGRVESVGGAGSRTISIPVVGGVSSGKTAFITAYVNDVITKKATPANGLTTSFYNADKERMFNTMSREYAQGVVTKTAAVTNGNVPSAFSMSFYINDADPSAARLKRQRLVQILDIAGETFVSTDRNAVNEQQRQYRTGDGIVLMIDPMALPQAEAKYGSELASGDKGSISQAPLEDVIAALNSNLNEVTDLNRSGNKLKTPLAVVINKVDEAEGLDNHIGEKAVQRMQAKDPAKYADSFDDTDFLCRQFLVDMDMSDVVDLIDQNFSNVRYFSVSAIGHTAGDGKGFEPKNVDAVMDWIIRQTDSDLADCLQSHTFSKAKLPIETPAVGAFDTIVGEA